MDYYIVIKFDSIYGFKGELWCDGIPRSWHKIVYMHKYNKINTKYKKIVIKEYKYIETKVNEYNKLSNYGKNIQILNHCNLFKFIA